MSAVSLHPSIRELAPGIMFRGFQLLEQIGIGGQGVVWSALDNQNKRILAIKFNEIPESDEAEADDIRDAHQLEHLIGLRQKYILPVLEYGFEDRVRYIISPYLPGGTLARQVKVNSLTLHQSLQFGMQIASALDYLHGMGIIHRDIKASNILLDFSGNTYLADFGLARLITTSTLAFHTGHGTPPYSPPEQIQLKAITPRSDIFSFGILLYEIFTGQLPWNGKRQLGLEQTHSNNVLPDPHEFNHDLPPQTADVLRVATSADPSLRPDTAGGVMEMLYEVFEIKSDQLNNRIDTQPPSITKNRDVDEILQNGHDQWRTNNSNHFIGVTKFALVDLERDNLRTTDYDTFLLAQALAYGHYDSFWWARVRDTSSKINLLPSLLDEKNETITRRILQHLATDTSLRSSKDTPYDSLVLQLVNAGVNAENPNLRQTIFRTIRTITPFAVNWNEHAQETAQWSTLGHMALEDSDAGDAAAELIGHLKIAPSVQTILQEADEGRIQMVLSLIQQEAGGLPKMVKGSVRFRLALEWIVDQVLQQPGKLFTAYMTAFLGAALGVGTQVYLTYNLPDFLDIARITTSLEQGLIVGSIFGLGIFLTRLVNERLIVMQRFSRVLLGFIAGGITINAAFFLFHVLFLSTPPMGWVMIVGSFLIALGFSLASLGRSRWFKTIISTVVMFTALAGTWWVHINYATSPVNLTPLFRYDYTWEFTKISLISLGISTLTAIFANLTSLSLQDN